MTRALEDSRVTLGAPPADPENPLNGRFGLPCGTVATHPGGKGDPVDVQRLYATTDAVAWAQEFVKVCPECDLGLAIGWFANAISVAELAARAHQRA
jgi:hypothetical protein